MWITFEEAAQVLNQSYASLLRQVANGSLPIEIKTCVKLEDLVLYKEKRSELRQKVLDELAKEAQEMGFYFD